MTTPREDPTVPLVTIGDRTVRIKPLTMTAEASAELRRAIQEIAQAAGDVAVRQYIDTLPRIRKRIVRDASGGITEIVEEAAEPREMENR